MHSLLLIFIPFFSVSHKNYWMCCDNLDMSRNDKLKAVLNEYFDSQSLEETDEVSMVTEEPVSAITRSRVKKIISSSIQLSMKFIMLINV